MLLQRRAVRRALRILATGADAMEISDRLKRMNVYGRPGNPTQCPIARYLKKTTGMIMSVNPEYTMPKLPEYTMPKLNVSKGLAIWIGGPVPLPPSVEDFVRRFDRGYFTQNDELSQVALLIQEKAERDA